MKNQEKNLKSGASHWADEVMGSLDGMERAKANPFMFTRILARIEKRDGPWEKVASWVSKPAFAFSMVLVFLAVNAAVLLNSQAEAEAAVARAANKEQMLAAEFSNSQNYTLVDVNEDK